MYDETNSTEATRAIRNRLHSGNTACMRTIAQHFTDDQLLLLQALILGQPNVTRRQAVEWFIVRRVVTVLIDAGYLLTVHDGEEATLKYNKDVNQIVGALMTTDEDRLYVFQKVRGTCIGWVQFVYGNDGWDVVSDYTTNLEDVLRPVFDLIGEIEP